MIFSNTIGAIAAAMAAAQGEFPSIVKDRTAKVELKTGGSYKYEYADLATVIEACRKVLAKFKLAVMQSVCVDGAKVKVSTWVGHESGEWMQSSPLEIMADSTKAQAIGSAATYARRYSLSAMLGIAPETDEDGNLANGNNASTQARGNGGNGRPAPSTPPSPASSGSLNMGSVRPGTAPNLGHGNGDSMASVANPQAGGSPFVDSLAAMDQAKKQQAPPVPPPEAPASQPAQPDLAIEAKIQATKDRSRKLWATARANGWTDAQIRAELEKRSYASTDSIPEDKYPAALKLFSKKPPKSTAKGQPTPQPTTGTFLQ